VKNLTPTKKLWIVSGPIGTDYTRVKPIRGKQVEVFISIYDFLKESQDEIDLKNLRQERQILWTKFYEAIRNGVIFVVADSFSSEKILEMKTLAQNKGYNVHVLIPLSPGPNIGFWNTKRLGLHITAEKIFDYYGDVSVKKL
jgi:predicted ABC-type ATPase